MSNDSSAYGSTWLSALRTVAITGDDSEADTPHQYCQRTRTVGVGVRPLKPGPVLGLASSLHETTILHIAGWKAGRESVLEQSFYFLLSIILFLKSVAV